MRYEFKLPDIGEGIHEAELLEWRVSVGQAIRDGEDIATLNTDKVTVDLPAPCDGKIVALHGAPGQVLVVGTVIAEIETDSKLVGQASANQKALEAMHGAKAHTASGASPKGNGAYGAQSGVSQIVPPPPVVSETIIAGPSTRKRARELEVDLKRVAGTGPSGRILRSDVEAAAAGQGAHAPAQPALGKATQVASPAGARRIPLSGARAVSARNLHDSVQRTVTTTTTFEVMGDGIKALLAKLKPAAEKRALKLSPLYLIAKCAAAALSRHERFNANIDEATGELVLYDQVDLGVAVAAGDRLVVPVIRGVDKRLLFDVVQDVSDVAQRAREGRLQVSDLKGATFTVSSTGGLERANIISTRPIINPPQTACLWVSRIVDRPRVIDGQLCAGPMLQCSLSFDHRYIDGAEATVFINDLAEYLEHPEQALV
jgi:pyruvate dehydrogenase E2 component (dihydrolipoamide acetyltransferase)